ncbi:MAG: hypothetical protein JWM91_4657 [Rhodospirillales bacterium]|nr:hypothetical protein [Rhodospirillales bacterium]
MTPVISSHIEKACECLITPKRARAIGLAEDRGRATYVAAFHAAQAFILLSTGKIAKTQTGLRTEFARLAKAGPHIGSALTSFLGQSYKLRSVADYGVGQEITVTPAEADAAIEVATRFIYCIREIIAADDEH